MYLAINLWWPIMAEQNLDGGEDDEWGLDEAPVDTSMRWGWGGGGLHECESESENDRVDPENLILFIWT